MRSLTKTLKPGSPWICRIKGAWDGHTGRAGFDDTGRLQSLFLAQKLKEFDQYRSLRVSELERFSQALWMEASVLMADDTHSVPTGDDPRSRKRRNKAHQETIIRLTQIREDLRSKTLLAEQELTGTAALLQSRLLAYAHGVSRQAAGANALPVFQLDFREYLNCHHDQLNALDHYIGGV